MSIASEITSIGENLKKDYQSIANLGADLTGVDKNIENIAELLDGVYDNLPKTEYQEGTEVNLGKTIKGKLDYDNGVVGIGQSSQDTTTGKNLWNITNYNNATINANQNATITKNIDNFKIHTSGLANSGAYISPPRYIDNFDSSTRYYLSFDITSSADTSRFVYGQGTVVTSLTKNTTKRLIVDIIGSSALVFYVNDELDLSVENIMVCATNDSAYEPYTNGPAPNPTFSFPINSVTGNQDVVVSGINLADITQTPIIRNNITQYSVSGDNIEIRSTESNTNAGIMFQYEVKKGENVAISYDEMEQLSDNNNNILSYTFSDTLLSAWTQGTLIDKTNKSVITTATGKYLAIALRTGNANGYTLKKLQVTYGNEVLPYEPYITPTSYQLSLGDIELNAIGNYKDELIYDVENDRAYKNGSIYEIGKDEVLQRLSSSFEELTDVVRGVINLGNLPSSISSANGLCSHLVFLADFTRNIEHFYVQSTQIFFFIKKSRLSEISRTGIYNYLATLTDLKFCYVMNTQIETEITDTNLHNQVKALYNAHSNNGTTIITSNGDLPMIIKVRGLKGE